MAYQQLIDKLNQALNKEVTTFLRYMLQASLIKGAEWEAVRSMYQAEVQDEMGHAQYLTDKIVALGGVPKLAPDLSPPPRDVKSMLANDIEQERLAVAGYIELSKLAEEASLIDLKMKMEEQAADEAAHADTMSRLLG